MAKKKKRRGVRTYTPHSFNTILYPLLGVLMVGILVAFLFLPMFSFAKDGQDTLTFNGLDFIKLCFMKLLPFLALPAYQTFLADFASAHPTNELLVIIAQYHFFIEIAVASFILLAFIFAVVLLILSVFWLIKGQSDKSSLLNTFSLLTGIFFLIGIGLAYMYFFFYHWIIDSEGIVSRIDLSIPLLISLLALVIFGGIIYALYHYFFKERIALEKGGRHHEENKKNAIKDTKEEKAPASEEVTNKIEEPLPVYQEEKGVKHQQVEAEEEIKLSGKAAVITVGDIAYAKNKEITSAVINEGIHALGSSAFADCHELTSVSLPSSLIDIGFNCFMNTPKLKEIVFNGSVERWRKVSRGSNWLHKSGTKTVKCLDGQINVDTRH